MCCRCSNSDDQQQQNPICSSKQQRHRRFTVVPVAEQKAQKSFNSGSELSSDGEEFSLTLPSAAALNKKYGAMFCSPSADFMNDQFKFQPSIKRNGKKCANLINDTFGRVVHFADTRGQPLASFRLIPSWRDDNASEE